MSDASAHITMPISASSTRNSLLASLGLVVGFWWAATGLTLAMQKSSAASIASIVVTSMLALVGVVLIKTSRTDATAYGARNAFLGSALVWWWCSSLFYAGIGVSIAPATDATRGSALLAAQAIASTMRVDLLGVFALIAIGFGVRRAPNKLAFWSLAAFFGTLQTAKLNVFFGVRNSGIEWLPSHLAGLAQFFGPDRNSALLPVTVLLLSLITLALVRHAVKTHAPFTRHAHAMLGFLVGLAVIEHIFLGVTFTLPLWNVFMAHN